MSLCGYVFMVYYKVHDLSRPLILSQNVKKNYAEVLCLAMAQLDIIQLLKNKSLTKVPFTLCN